MMTRMPAARDLREALDRPFDALAGDRHQVGHLVDDVDDDAGQRHQVERLVLEYRLAGAGVEAGPHAPRDQLALGLGLLDAAPVAIEPYRRFAKTHLRKSPIRGMPGWIN